MTNDLISNMLTCIRNASASKHIQVLIPYSKTNLNILSVLEQENYISYFKINNVNKILVGLKYQGWWLQKPTFTILKRISKPGQRLFSSYRTFEKKFPLLKHSKGIAIISTSGGIMSHIKAKTLKKGGEILCYIN